jgi:multidrug efflux pump subunit AcrB
MGISGRISGYFLRHSITPLLALVALLMGVFATLITPREEEPQIEVTMANVMVPFPGASARDVEALIAKPGEQVLSRMAGVEHVFSVSRPGMAVMTVQFKVGVPEQTALVRLYDTVHSHQDWLSPELGVGAPIVKPKGIDDVPIVALTLWSKAEGGSSFDLQQVARSAESEFKRIDGVREVTTIGGPGRAIRVQMDADRMAAHGVSALDLRAALQLGNASRSAGNLVEGGREILVQAGVYLESVADVKHLVVGTANGRPVFIADVAEVTDGADQPTRHVWHGLGKASGGNGQTDYPAVTLAMSKKPGVNAADVAAAVIARAESLKGSLIPDAVEVSVTRNYGATATEKAQKLIGKLGFATAFVVLLVLFALGKREAIIVGTAVTLTLAATLFASWAYGFTLNRVSLFALIFSIGILVDDAIVVVENIHRSHHLHPEKSLAELIPGAVDEVGGPTILATFTVIAALLPMAFVSGLMGPYMSPIPINSSMGMFISLAVAFIVTPWLALKMLPARVAGHGSHSAGGQGGDDRLTQRLDGFFRRVMRPLLGGTHGRRNRGLLWGVILIAIVVSVALGAVKLVVLKMLPLDNKSEMQVVLDMPVGTPVDQTARVLREIAEYLATVPEVRDYEGYAGTASPINFNGLVRQYYLRSASEMGDLQVNLVDKHHRDRSSHQVAGAVRATVAAIARKHGGNAKTVEVPPGPPVLSPIVAEVYGPDYDGQIELARRIRAIFEKTPDVVDVDDSISAVAEKKVLKISPAKAAGQGVNQRDIVDVVAMALAGESVTPLHDGVSQYEAPIRIVLPEEKQSSLDQLLKLRVRATSGPNAGALVPLSEVVEVISTRREQAIFHKDLLPVVYVTGDMAGKLDSPLYGMFDIRSQLPAEVDQYFIHAPRDPYATYAIKWDGEWQITYETFRDMGIAYAVGLVLIYLLVVAQFGSYLAPLVIMAPIPLTIMGVMPGHALLGAQFTATSMIGMISLAGIIVRNSILLTDFINLQRAAGVDFEEAVIRAAVVRAKPIALTALAAMLGALFILDDPIFNGLAISLIFGILVSTLLTLVVIPVLYYAAFRNRPLVAE